MAKVSVTNHEEGRDSSNPANPVVYHRRHSRRRCSDSNLRSDEERKSGRIRVRGVTDSLQHSYGRIPSAQSCRRCERHPSLHRAGIPTCRVDFRTRLLRQQADEEIIAFFVYEVFFVINFVQKGGRCDNALLFLLPQKVILVIGDFGVAADRSKGQDESVMNQVARRGTVVPRDIHT